MLAQTPTMVNLPSEPGKEEIISVFFLLKYFLSEARLVIAAIGEAGEGKSTLLNLILNSPGESRELFAVSEEPEACTTSPSVRSGSGSALTNHQQGDTLRTK